MDLTKLETKTQADAGMWFRPVGPDGKALDCEFLLMGRDSVEFARYQDELFLEAQARIIKKQAPAPVEPSDARSARYVARMTKDWKGVEWEGKPLPFSKENAEMVFSRVPFLRDQADSFIGARDNFFARASKD